MRALRSLAGKPGSAPASSVPAVQPQQRQHAAASVLHSPLEPTWLEPLARASWGGLCPGCAAQKHLSQPSLDTCKCARSQRLVKVLACATAQAWTALGGPCLSPFPRDGLHQWDVPNAGSCVDQASHPGSCCKRTQHRAHPHLAPLLRATAARRAGSTHRCAGRQASWRQSACQPSARTAHASAQARHQGKPARLWMS